MVPTTDSHEQDLLAITRFYDSLAPEYDAMTGFEKRFVHEKPFFRLLVERYDIRSALDAGSGTGFHSLLLAQLGVQVTALEISRAMVQQLERHVAELKLPVRCVTSTFQRMREQIRGPLDAVFCLGNTLPHLLSPEDVGLTLHNFFSVLRPGGALFLQMLNYDRILSSVERVQSVKENSGKIFVRFYDYDMVKERIMFNLLTLVRREAAMHHELISVPLRPLRSASLSQALREAGFADVQFFGGIAMDPFEQATSRDLVAVATRAL